MKNAKNLSEQRLSLDLNIGLTSDTKFFYIFIEPLVLRGLLLFVLVSLQWLWL